MDNRSPVRTIDIEEAVLGKNQETATQNRLLFRHHGTLVVNVMSSPGSGKTALLETLLDRFAGRVKVAVIAADCATDNDAQRLYGRGADVVQIVTRGYCHVDAEMVSRALAKMDLTETKIVFVENVGNLVCPAAFDLGESLKVGVLSVTEGEDKPLKYPSLFSRVDAVVVNKIDIAEAVEWNRDLALEVLSEAAPTAPVFEVSARRGTGIAQLMAWLENGIPQGTEIS